MKTLVISTIVFIITASLPTIVFAFQTNDRVKATANLYVRSCPSITCSGTIMSMGSIGTISNTNYNDSRYRWWHINWDNGYTGYSVQDYLTVIPDSLTLLLSPECSAATYKILLDWTFSSNRTSDNVYLNCRYTFVDIFNSLIENNNGTYMVKKKDQTVDMAGKLLSIIDKNGNTIILIYKGSHLTQSADTVGMLVTFTYDSNGNKTKMVDSLGTSTYKYDILNRLTEYTDPFGKTIDYGYDVNGNRISLIYPDGKAVQYVYDELNRLTSVKDWLNRTTTYYYDIAGKLTTVMNFKSDSTGISIYGYSLDPLDNLSQSVQNKPLPSNIEDVTTRYGYDWFGNRLYKTTGDVTTRYVLDINESPSRVLAETDDSGNITAYYVYGIGLVSKILSDDNKL